MVKILSQKDNDIIAQAIEKAERNTRAEIAVVVTPASDTYLDFILLQGLLLSALLTISLWASSAITNFLELLAIQLSVLLLLFFLPVLRRLCLRFVPMKILHQRTARRALEEFHTVHRQLPATAPMVLFFVSLGERYAHILSSHAVYEILPDSHWDTIIADFGKTMPQGLPTACTSAIEHIGTILREHFPENGESYNFSNQVIEKP